MFIPGPGPHPSFPPAYMTHYPPYHEAMMPPMLEYPPPPSSDIDVSRVKAYMQREKVRARRVALQVAAAAPHVFAAENYVCCAC